MANSLALIGVSFSGAERGRAIGAWSGFISITMAIGLVLGGGSVQHASWRWAFLSNVPIALAVVGVTLLRAPESAAKIKDEPRKRVVWVPGSVQRWDRYSLEHVSDMIRPNDIYTGDHTA